jgi:hypothetical protein
MVWTPSIAENPESVAKVHKLVTRDCQIALELKQDKLQIKQVKICYFPHKDLGKRKICGKFVPHSLTDE